MARSPYTTRFTRRCTQWRTGWKATATTAVATIDSTRLPEPPTRAPIPTTNATYTTVTNTANTPYTRVLLMTTSMSKSRYRRIATAAATGMPANTKA